MNVFKVLCATLAFASPLPVFAQSPMPAAETAGKSSILRSFSIAELGLRNGVQFSGLTGQRDVFFPLGGVEPDSAVLRLDLSGGSAFEAMRSLEISVDDQIVRTLGLGEEDASLQLRIPLDPATFTSDFVKLSLRYKGSLYEDRCIDNRAGGDYLAISPQSGIDFGFAPETLDSIEAVAALMPDPVTVYLPDRPLEGPEMAAALHVARAFGTTDNPVRFSSLDGAVLSDSAALAPWTAGSIVIDGDGGMQGDEANGRITTSRLNGQPALVLHGIAPDKTAAFVASNWVQLAGTPSAEFSALEMNASGSAANTVALTNAPLSGELNERLWLETGFRAQDLPAGMRPKSVAMDLAVASDYSGRSAAVSLFANNQLVASTTADPGTTVRLHGALPSRIIGRDNALRVLVQRQPEAGDCNTPPQTFTAQVLPSSMLELEADPSPKQDFYELAGDWRDGVDLYLPQGKGTLAELNTLAAIAAPLFPADAPVSVTFGPPPKTATDFIVFAKTLPMAFTAPLDLGADKVRLADRDGGIVMDTAAIVRHDVAQLVTGTAGKGLWVRAADGDASGTMPEKPVFLDRGNVALIDGDRIAVAFTSGGGDVIAAVYPEEDWLGDLVDRYWFYIIVSGWLATTVVLAIGLAKSFYRREG